MPSNRQAFEDDLDGNFWFCEAFEAVNIGVVDYCDIDFTECSSLQVFSTDVALSRISDFTQLLELINLVCFGLSHAVINKTVQLRC